MPIDRLIVTLLILALAVWRVYRYIRLGVSGRSRSLGVPGGVLLPKSDDERGTTALEQAIPPKQTAISRVVSALATVLVWILGNLLIWGFLFGTPRVREAPTILLGVLGIFVNFYLIPLAGRTGRHCATLLVDSGGPQ